MFLAGKNFCYEVLFLMKKTTLFFSKNLTNGDAVKVFQMDNDVLVINVKLKDPVKYIGEYSCVGFSGQEITAPSFIFM